MSSRQRRSTESTRQRSTVNSTPASTPSRSGFYHLRERLEKQLSSSQINKEKQVSPTLEKLQMTPGILNVFVLIMHKLSIYKKVDR